MLNVIQKLKTYGIKMKRFNLLKKHIEKKEMFLYYGSCCYGKCGTPTGLRDLYGESLFVGDVVKVFDKKKLVPDFISVVIEDNDKHSIWGIFNSFLCANSEWIIRKYDCYTTIIHETKINMMTYVKK